MKNKGNKREIIDKLFTAIILVLFAAYMFLWIKVEAEIPRYVVGAALLLTAIAFKVVDKKAQKKDEEKLAESEAAEEEKDEKES